MKILNILSTDSSTLEKYEELHGHENFAEHEFYSADERVTLENLCEESADSEYIFNYVLTIFKATLK